MPWSVWTYWLVSAWFVAVDGLDRPRGVFVQLCTTHKRKMKTAGNKMEDKVKWFCCLI